MHLNNKGWGTGQMIAMTCFLLILLAVTWYYINSLFGGALTKNAVSVKTEYYETVKSSLKKSAQNYYNDNGYTGSAIFTYTMLKDKGYISNIRDFLDLSCTGYVVVNNGTFSPYIRCNNYTSDGYVIEFE